MRRQFRRVVRRSRRQLRRSCRLLCRIRCCDEEHVGALLDFQPGLSQLVFELARADQVAVRRQKFIVRQRLADRARPLRRLAAQRDAIRELQAAARGLGDAFAWFFYQFDEQLLSEHAQRPLVGRMSAGSGGQAEALLAQQFQMFQGCLVIHHSLTTRLRLGDLSLWDPQIARIVAIAEAKTSPGDDSTAIVRLQFIIKADARFEPTPTTSDPRPSTALPDVLVTRQRQQSRRIAKSLSAVWAPSNGSHVESRVATHIGDLDRLISAARVSRPEFQQLGPGLLACAVMARRGASRESKVKLFDTVSKALCESIRDLVRPGSPHNCLVIGSVYYDKRGWPVSQLGVRPLFWTELGDVALTGLALGRVAVVTVFNPAHIFEDAAAAGLSIRTVQPPWGYNVTWEDGPRTARLEHFEYFLRLRTTALYTHTSVVQAIIDAKCSTASIPPNIRARVTFNFQNPLLKLPLDA